MLPDLRFVLGAAVATAILGVSALGLVTSVRLAHQAKISPLEASRSLAFAERADWDRYPEGARGFEELLRRAGVTPTQRADEPSPAIAFPRSALFWPIERMGGPDDVPAPAAERIETVAALAENPPAPPSEEPQATGSLAPRTTEAPSESAAKSEAENAEPLTKSEPDATAGDARTTVAAVTPNPEAAEPAPAQEQAVAKPPQLRKAAVRKRAKRPRTARARQVNQHASTGYPITPVRNATTAAERKQASPSSNLDAE